jgi:serine/threonine protein kinase
MGTPAYMSPEQSQAAAVDHRSDIFNLGATAWQCLCGKSPRNLQNSGPGFEGIGQPIPSARKFRPDLPDGLDVILNSMLAQNPNERYSSAAHVLKDVQTLRYGKKRPQGAFEGSVFVAIPYAARFTSIFDAIERACEATRMRANRMDRLVFIEDIWSQTVSEIERARVVVADFTPESWKRSPNPNVVTEAAHARAMNKPLVLLTQNSPERLPFDWRHMPVVRYRTGRVGLETLIHELSSKLRELRQRPR